MFAKQRSSNVTQLDLKRNRTESELKEQRKKWLEDFKKIDFEIKEGKNDDDDEDADQPITTSHAFDFLIDQDVKNESAVVRKAHLLTTLARFAEERGIIDVTEEDTLFVPLATSKPRKNGAALNAISALSNQNKKSETSIGRLPDTLQNCAAASSTAESSMAYEPTTPLRRNPLPTPCNTIDPTRDPRRKNYTGFARLLPTTKSVTEQAKEAPQTANPPEPILQSKHIIHSSRDPRRASRPGTEPPQPAAPAEAMPVQSRETSNSSAPMDISSPEANPRPPMSFSLKKCSTTSASSERLANAAGSVPLANERGTDPQRRADAIKLKVSIPELKRANVVAQTGISTPGGNNLSNSAASKPETPRTAGSTRDPLAARGQDRYRKA
jgi:hypothetical protein